MSSVKRVLINLTVGILEYCSICNIIIIFLGHSISAKCTAVWDLGAASHQPAARVRPDHHCYSDIGADNMPEPELEKICSGGLSYQVVLQDARGEVPSVKCPATPTPTVKEIEKKLKV